LFPATSGVFGFFCIKKALKLADIKMAAKIRIAGIPKIALQHMNLGASPQLECWNNGMLE
jgi:hypothetical protein